MTDKYFPMGCYIEVFFWRPPNRQGYYRREPHKMAEVTIFTKLFFIADYEVKLKIKQCQKQ